MIHCVSEHSCHLHDTSFLFPSLSLSLRVCMFVCLALSLCVLSSSLSSLFVSLCLSLSLFVSLCLSFPWMLARLCHCYMAKKHGVPWILPFVSLNVSAFGVCLWRLFVSFLVAFPCACLWRCSQAGRCTKGFYDIMGIDDTIATDPAE